MPAGWASCCIPKGEYFHYMATPIDSYKGWRIGLPPQWYPTHSNAYYVGVTGGSFTEVSCMGMPSVIEHLQPANNRYKNPFGTEIALFRTSEGGMSRMAVSWDTPGSGGEMGRIRGQKGSYYGKYEGLEKKLPDTQAPAAAARCGRRRPRRFARLSHERVRHGHPAGPQAAGGYRPGPEHDRRRHRRPPVRPEGRRVEEDTAVQA